MKRIKVARTKGTYLDQIEIFLENESVKFNVLIKLIMDTLRQVKRVAKGEEVLDEDTESLCNQIYSNQVPTAWKDKSFSSERALADWVADLCDRAELMKSWLHKTPRAFRLGVFYFPQGFLTAVMQNYSRMYQIPIDLLAQTFECTPYMDHLMIPDDAEQNAPTTLIYGLYAEGCRVNLETLSLTDNAVGQAYAQVPVLKYIPIEEDALTERKQVSIPLYKTAARKGSLTTTGHSTNFITCVNMNSIEAQDFWTLRGAALLCQLDKM